MEYTEYGSTGLKISRLCIGTGYFARKDYKRADDSWQQALTLDPDVFENVFDTVSFAPKRANRGYYSNPEVDRLIAEGRRSVDEKKRAAVGLVRQRHPTPARLCHFWLARIDSAAN